MKKVDRLAQQEYMILLKCACCYKDWNTLEATKQRFKIGGQDHTACKDTIFRNREDLVIISSKVPEARIFPSSMR